MEIEFLSVADVLYIHANQVGNYGGEHGVREAGLLESAVAQPQAMYEGEYLHSDIYHMAAAYMFHIVCNHPFIDGNKRTGAVTAIVFLAWNRIELKPDNDALYGITIKTAEGNSNKEEIAEYFRSFSL